MTKLKEELVVEIIDQPLDNKAYSLWYSGNISVLSKGKDKIVLSAYGDVICSLNGEHRVKDKNNMGIFFDVYKDIFKDDAELQKAIDDQSLDLIDENWFQADVYRDDEYVDGFVLEEEDDVNKAIARLTKDFDSYIKYYTEAY